MDEETIKNISDAIKKNFLEYTQNGKIKQTIQNAVLCLRLDGWLIERFRFNNFTHNINVTDSLEWDPNPNPRAIRDVDFDHIVNYLEINYQLNNDKKIKRALNIIADKYKFHPIIDFLEGITWDKTNRLDHVLTHFLGVEENEYTVTALKIFMLGALKRIYKPGCKFDYSLILVGDQGVGKSTFFRFLAIKDEWFTDDVSNINDEKIYQKIKGHWIIEFSEMLTVKKAKDVESIKSFLTRQVDTYKIPYATYAEDFQRQCVFGGTTNNIEFLPADKTGQRRFLPIFTKKEKMEKHILEDEDYSRNYIIQCWAEALEIYKSGDYSLTLSAKLEEYANKIREESTPEDVTAAKIQEWLDNCSYNIVCAPQIYKEALENFDNPKRFEIDEIHKIMRQNVIGWERCPVKKKIKNYGVIRAYERITQKQDNPFLKN